MVLIALTTSNCSKETKLGKFYHNVTARFNGYFNATVKYEESKTQFEEQFKDDYSKLLPIFIYPDEAQGKNMASELDIVIKKCSRVIQRHEVSKWIDDCYLLIGKAYFYKRELFEGLESFQFVYTEYKRNPIKWDALLWIARSYLETEQYSQARTALDLVTAKKNNFPEALKGEYFLIEADYYIKRKQYKEAIQNLAIAINFIKKKKDAARYHYILAQLYEMQERKRQAKGEYDLVLKAKPGYDLFFNAQLSRARLFSGRGSDGKDIKKSLTKMIKDEKNKEYLDQLYYELAGIELKEGNKQEALDLYSKSAAASTGNNAQKAKTYVTVADLYFEQPNYPKAKLYYDSAATVLPKDFPNYKEVIAKKDNLGDLVIHLNTIHTQDSLLELSAFSDAKLAQYIAKAIRKEREAEERLKENEKQNEEVNPAFANLPNNNQGNQRTGNTFYFYDQNSVSKGIGDFRTTWGNRNLEDNWRRKSKTQVAFNGNNNNNSDANAPEGETDEERTARYLANVPRTDSAKNVAQNKIIEAYYALGKIYKDKLFDEPKAIESFETLLDKYPENQYKLITTYHLFILHKNAGEEEKANKYKNIILNDYPESTYAQLITNPDQFKNDQAKAEESLSYYEETYRFFQKENYQTVFTRSQTALTKYPTSSILAKFELLAAMALGKVSSKDSMKIALRNLIKKYPKTEEEQKAEEILKLLEPKTASNSSKPDSLEQNGLFKIKDNEPHYYVSVVAQQEKDSRLIKKRVYDFNKQKFSLDGLKTNNMLMGLQHELTLVKEFPNKTKAMAYFRAATQDSKRFEGLSAGSYQHFVITKSNFVAFYKNKAIEDYLAFFRSNYQ